MVQHRMTTLIALRTPMKLQIPLCVHRLSALQSRKPIHYTDGSRTHVCGVKLKWRIFFMLGVCASSFCAETFAILACAKDCREIYICLYLSSYRQLLKPLMCWDNVRAGLFCTPSFRNTSTLSSSSFRGPRRAGTISACVVALRIQEWYTEKHSEYWAITACICQSEPFIKRPLERVFSDLLPGQETDS